MNQFRCSHCQKMVSIDQFMGTSNRNHCPFCLWSKHVDQDTPGDRKSKCQTDMKPIGLTFKKEGLDKWGKPKQGELMIIHECTKKDKISINRIASDDDPKSLMQIFYDSQNLDQKICQQLTEFEIQPLTLEDEPEIKKQLLGRS